MPIRRLHPDDADAFYVIRLEALRNAPRAFGTSAMEQQARGVADVRARLLDPRFTAHGAFATTEGGEGERLGVVGMRRSDRAKDRHVATLVSMYVVPSARAQHLGRQLVQAALDALTGTGVLQVNLCVSADNAPARRLYSAMGFEVWGVETRSLRVDGQDVDTEYRVRFLDR